MPRVDNSSDAYMPTCIRSFQARFHVFAYNQSMSPSTPSRCLVLLFCARVRLVDPALPEIGLQGAIAMDPSLFHASTGFDLMDTLDAIDADASRKRVQRWLSVREIFMPILSLHSSDTLLKADLSSIPRWVLPTLRTAPSPQQWRAMRIDEPLRLDEANAIASVNARIDAALLAFSDFGARALFRPGPMDCLSNFPMDIRAVHAMAALFLQGIAASDERALLALSTRHSSVPERSVARI